MTRFLYTDSAFPIRDDLVDAHRYAWAEMARAGNWWNGSERIAIATEVRNAWSCGYCAQCKDALSPHASSGAHTVTSAQLPAPAIEAIHLITTDPARLTKQWYRRLVGDDFTDGHYVELVGILVTVVCIDTVHRVLGVPPEPLPHPVAGAPSRVRPPTATLSDQAWVPMISAPAARGTPESDLYPGKHSANIIKAMSLVPDAVRMLNKTQKAHYVDISRLGFAGKSDRAISRPQIELLAARVSALNECFYSTVAHTSMLRASSRAQGIAVDVKGVVERGSGRVGVPHEAILLAFADAAVLRDQSGIEAARGELARALGAAAVVDAACIVGNYERMNRIADACGIALGRLEFLGDESLRELEIAQFNSAANSQPTAGIKGLLMRFVGKRMLAKMQRAAS